MVMMVVVMVMAMPVRQRDNVVIAVVMVMMNLVYALVSTPAGSLSDRVDRRLPLAAGLVRTLDTRTDGPALNAALARTGVLQLIFCLLLAAGILAGGGIGS